LRLVLVLVAGLLVTSCESLERQREARQANPAPCPNVFVLDDVAEFVHFEGDEKELESVTYSGEITDVATSCRYFSDRPIQASVDIAFAIGRGPAATQNATSIDYFVAVTRTDRDVIAKETFTLPVTFRRGESVAYVTRSIESITIPRLDDNTSGVNFEIAVGFALERGDVLYNRSGKSLKFPDA
jgi:hypothetical protein